MHAVFWFKRDLRTQDHPALTRAVAWTRATGGALLPLYIVEPDYWRLPDTSARQWAFIAETLTELRADVAGLGAPLIVRIGEAVDVLDDLCRAHRVTHLFSHEETGNGWTFARDRRVAAWARAAGICWEEVPQGGVIRRLKDRSRWIGLRDAHATAPLLPAPSAIRALAAVEPGAIPTVAELGLTADLCPGRQTGGRSAGLRLLDSFLTERGEHYRTAMSSPLAGERACSRLSPHLAVGTLSGREVGRAGALRRVGQPGRLWTGALVSFDRRLAWRDYFMQRLEDHPRIEFACLDRRAERLRHRQGDVARLAAWSVGETGLPFVDACIRYLAATGWLNFRMRSMLMAVASYHFWLDWRQTGPVLARAFTDYEPGIHWSQVQMQSGTTGFNPPRIYNPIKQAYDQDPAGVFTRRWCPELADVPDSFLQEPWKWPRADALLGRRYPRPIIDVAASAQAAREAIGALRRGASGSDTVRTVDRYRKAPDTRFDAHRAKRPPTPPATAQLSFDL